MTPRRPIIGVGAVVFKDGEILLVRRGTAPRLGEWSIPGGAQEWGETIIEAAHREVREETGLNIEVLGLIDAVDSLNRDNSGHLRYHHTLIDLAARWVSGEARPGSDVTAVAWVNPANLTAYGLWRETERVVSAALTMFAEKASSKMRPMGSVCRAGE